MRIRVVAVDAQLSIWTFLLLPDALNEYLVGVLHSKFFISCDGQLMLIFELGFFYGRIYLILKDILEWHFPINIIKFRPGLSEERQESLFIFLLNLRNARQVTGICAHAVQPSLAYDFVLVLAVTAYILRLYGQRVCCGVYLHYVLLQKAFLYFVFRYFNTALTL